MRRVWALVLLPLLAGCYFLLEPPEPKEKEIKVPEPVPVPIPVVPPLPQIFEHHGLSLLWLVRMDAHTGNLAAAYGALHEQVHQALRARSIPVEGEAVGSLYDERLFWGRNRDVPAPVTVEQSLRHAAALPQEPMQACTTSSLAFMGFNLPELEVVFPDEPPGPGDVPPIEVTRRVKPFAAPMSAFLVILVDPGPRPSPVDAPACRHGTPSASHYFGARSPVLWLRPAEQRLLVREQIRFALIGTPEEVSLETMTGLCEAVPGFPRPALDVIEPSPVRFFDRFDEDLRPMTERVDLCEALGGGWNVERFVDELLAQLERLQR